MKKLFCIVLAFAMIAALAACGSGAKSIDTKALAEDLKNGLTWQSEMTEESEDILKIALGLPDDAEAVGYQSDGTTPEFIAVVTCEDAEAAQEGINSYLDETETQMSQYHPEQVELAQNGVMEVVGAGSTSYIIVCVNADAAAAQEIISSYLK